MRTHVVLNSGGPIMEVVARLRNGDVSCVWHMLDGPQEHIFHPKMLTTIEIELPPIKGCLDDDPDDPWEWWK